MQNLNDLLLVLEKEPEDKATINEIFRAAHSLKGMAGTMGYKRMQNLTHNMENVFSEIRNDKMKVTASLIDTLSSVLMHLRAISTIFRRLLMRVQRTMKRLSSFLMSSLQQRAI